MDGYEKNVKVIDQWVDRETGIYRLIDSGAGPIELQVMELNEWKKERRCYTHAVLCERIISLVNTNVRCGD